ncbi:helix-turn-helix transcriptional regulator [Nocardia testacea]|uniref:helix-turn-helix transcriptional regulator n=1 Tax=Nocardia testacea TaxID=248551 RepID=UPI000A00A798|nr:helix-turn-helix transcriptional regulator [Nocardia testacea]
MTGRIVVPAVGRAALADELAREIKRLRTEAGMSQRVLAGRIGYSRQYVSMAEWEDANLPSRELVAAVDSELAANGALNALRARADAATRASRFEVAYGESAGSTGSDTFGDQAIGGEFPAAGRSSDELLEVLRRIHRITAAVDREIVERLASRVHAVIEDYEFLDGAKLVDGLVEQRQLIDTLTEDCGDIRERRRLYEIAAKTSGLLGFVNVGFGNFELSRAYCYEAFQLGSVVQSPDLQAWARGMQSYCEYYSGYYREALQFAEDGLNYAASGPQQVRLKINGVARALGKLGDRRGVDRAVEEAYELVGEGGMENHSRSSISISGYSRAQVAGNAATAYLSLGMPDRVEAHVKDALAEMDPAECPWGRSLAKIDLARAQLSSRKGDLDYASSLIIEALESTPADPTVPVRARAAEFARDLMARGGSASQLATVREAMAAHRSTDAE